MAQMLPRYLGDVIWPRHRGMWECRRGIIRVSETEEKIGDSRSTRRCHEGAWMLACRSISILCFHLPSLVPCYSIHVVHVVIQLSYRRILKRIFLKIFQISTMISQFFHGERYRYRYRSHINETFQLPRTRKHFL